MNSKKSYTVKEAQKYLEHFCAYQERTHQEVEQKLYKMGMVQEARDAIILFLLQHDFLNEERYAKAFVSGKFRIKKWGRIKIKQVLKQKGVSAANITLGLDEIDEKDYLETIQKLQQAQFDKLKARLNPSLSIEKKYSIEPLAKQDTTLSAQESFEVKQKVIRYLQQKGYELALIYEIMNT